MKKVISLITSFLQIIAGCIATYLLLSNQMQNISRIIVIAYVVLVLPLGIHGMVDFIKRKNE